MYIRSLLAVIAFLGTSHVYADDCTQEQVKGDWQLQQTRIAGEDGLGLRCTIRITPKGNVASGNAATACDYSNEFTPTVKGSFTVTDTPLACLLNINIRILGGSSGREAFLQREVRLNADRDAADWHDSVLEDKQGTEIYSGPISLYKY